MTTMLIACNETRESGSFCGDQLCSMKAAQMFVRNQPDVDRVVMSVSRANEMSFLWDRFVHDNNITLVHDDWNPGDWSARWCAWDQWRQERRITLDDGSMCDFQHYRELYLRIHGAQRQTLICGYERGLGRRNIYEYWVAGQENNPDTFDGSDVYDVEIDHPALTHDRDVWISPHCKTQGNYVFTFEFWGQVVRRLLAEEVTVTVGYDGQFYDREFGTHPCYRKHWGDHRAWMEQLCRHRLVACGNTGTGWLAAACGVPMITMEPHNSVMADHRYRECGLRNIVEVVDGHRLDSLDNDMGRVAEYVARRIVEEVRRKVVMTTGCYDVLHAGHVRHLERARAMGTRLVVALNSDASVKAIKGPERPINPEGQRKAVLEALRCVDEVRLFDGPDARALIEEVRPAVLAVGHGYEVKDIVGRDLVESWGGQAVVTCRGDARDEPSTTKIVKRVRVASLAEVCRLGAAHSVNPLDKLLLMAREFLSVVDLPGEVADLGAYQGGCSLVLRRLAPDKQLHVFDTWEGTPYDDPLCHHKRGEWVASMEDCQVVVGMCQNTYFHKGLFPETAQRANDDVDDYPWQFCFVYCDMDTYQATHDALDFFWGRLVPGGKMVIDDYGWGPCAGVQKAVDEVFPFEECGRYDGLPDTAYKRVVAPQYACILEKRA